jgi:hypothetical protein
MKQNKKALYLQKETYKQFKDFSKFNNFNNSEAINNLLHDSSYFKLTNLDIQKLKSISHNLLQYFIDLADIAEQDNGMGFDATLKLKSIIEKIEESNK